MIKSLLVVTLLGTSLLSASSTDQPNKEINKTIKAKKKVKSKPFLITGYMPHLTKKVKKNWDNPELAFTDVQKEKLIQVRKATIKSVMKLKKEILALEKDVSAATMSGETPESLKAKVDQIAKLKASATMTHIKCIYDTKNILDAKQFEFLLSK